MNYYFNKYSDLLPNVDPQSRIEKFFQFPITRMAIILILLAPSFLIIETVRGVVIKSVDFTTAVYSGYFFDVLLIAAMMITYRIYTSATENRKANEISFYKFLPEIGFGALIAFLIMTFFVLLISIPGYYSVEEFNSFGNVIFMFFDQLKVGFIEELLFRVIIFKLSEELFGSWTAIAVQGILFGFAHAGNPNATIYTTMALILSFSIFFGTAYMITRRIWFVMGFHWSWNFFQAGIYGIQNSGHTQPSLITPVIEGPVWITGGDWGAELSIISVIILFTLGIYFVKIAYSNNQFMKPKWRR
ncbi:MAG: CPBP family intramembrane metalloprotease [Melioribacteraceae bacterium]|nr:CPBP family intramembrane metalloprotease [Melioribacteraceae bacterium]